MFHEKIEGRNVVNGAAEDEFQTPTQRTRSSSSCLEEEDNDVADSVEPAMSNHNPIFPWFFSILTLFQIGSHEIFFMVPETRHKKKSV